MALLKDIQFSYDDLDGFFGKALGTEYPDFTCALYNGDFTLTLDEAQKRKRDFVLNSLQFERGKKILDIGCGWGNMLNWIREKGGAGVGVTLSPAQARRCQKNGLEAHLKDWKEMRQTDFGRFDGIVSLGAFEHFCSMEEFVGGRQERIYSNFMKLCSDLLPSRGRLFLQTMTWGKNLPWGAQYPTKMEEFKKLLDPRAPLRSDERTLYLVVSFFPGSFLPKRKEQILETASPYFNVVNESNGRLDYLQTVRKWEEAMLKNGSGSSQFTLKVLAKYCFGGPQGRAWINTIKESAMMHVFAGQIFDHYRLVFEKKE